MAKTSHRTESSRGPGKTHRFVNHFIMPPAIAWTTSAENGLYLAGKAARKHPGRAALCALAFGFALATARAARLKAGRDAGSDG